MSAAPRVAVVGAGITGLAAALRLLDLARTQGRALDLTLLEAGPAPGGKIRTERVGPLVIEQGPDSFLADKPWAKALCQRLGLGGELVGPDPAAARVYVVRGRRLLPLPEGLTLGVPAPPWALLRSPLLSPWGRLRALLEPLVPPAPPREDETVADFLRRRLGREAAERLAEPLLSSLYGGSAEELSAPAVVPRLVELERRYGSLTRGLRAARRGAAADMAATGAAASGAARGPEGDGGAPRAGARGRSRRGPAFLTLRPGLQRLVEAAAEALADARWVLGTPVEEVAPAAGGRWRVRVVGGGSEEFDAVVVTAPAKPAARMLAGAAPRAAEALAGIRYAPALVVALVYPPGSLELPAGSGFIVPEPERRVLSAATWASAKWPHTAPGGEAVLRCFVDARREPARLAWADAELVAAVRAELRELLRIGAEPAWVRIYRWPEALPCYALGHRQRVAAVAEDLAGLPGLAVAGAALEGVGIPDCVRQGEAAAERVAARLGLFASGMAAGGGA